VLAPVMPEILPSDETATGRLMTMADAAREAGIADWEGLLAQRAVELEAIQKIGLTFPAWLLPEGKAP
jgi:hypothetical protein